MKLFIVGLLLSSSLFAATNLMLPVLTCKLTQEEIQKLKSIGSNSSESITLIADFEDMMTAKNGKAVLLFHGSDVGAVSDSGDAGKVGGAELGTFSPEAITPEGFKNGNLYVGNLVTYNHKYKWITELNVVDASDQENIKVELLKKNAGEGGREGDSSTLYSCSMANQ